MTGYPFESSLPPRGGVVSRSSNGKKNVDSFPSELLKTFENYVAESSRLTAPLEEAYRPQVETGITPRNEGPRAKRARIT